LLTTVWTLSPSSWKTADAPHEEMSSAPPVLISTPSRLPEGSVQTFRFVPLGPRVYTSPVWLNDTTTRVPTGRTGLPVGSWRSGLFTATETFPDGSIL